MDIGSAFTYMFDDPDWVKKLAIGGGIAIGGVILSPIIVGLAILLLLGGYMLETLKSVRDGQKALPEWTDFGNLFMKGLMVFLIGLIYNIPSLIFSCLSGVTNGVMGQADSNSTLAQVLPILAACFGCFQLILSLAAAVITPAGLIRYARYDTFGAAFQFGEIFNFIKTNIGNYIVAILLGWVAGLVGLLGLIACIIGVFFTFFWATLVSANLYGQLARQAS